MSEPNELVPFPSAGDARVEVESLIPHRDPFLFIDRIVESDPERIAVEWTVREDAEFFRGHYPGQPVTPGVILCEHAFQAGALLVSKARGGFRQEDGVPVLTRIGEAKFKRLVPPGGNVETTVEVEDRLGPAWYMKATIRCERELCVRLNFVLSATGAMARVGRQFDTPQFDTPQFDTHQFDSEESHK